MRNLQVLLVSASIIASSAAAEPHESKQQSAPARPAILRSSNVPEFAESESGCADARILDYLERHGNFGRIDPEVLLYVTRVEHERRERMQRIPQVEGIAGNVWTSIGPTNGAGRATAVAVHPTTAGTAIIGAAGGGAWRTTDGGWSWAALTDSVANLSAGAISYAPSSPSTIYLGTGEGGYAIDFIPGIGLLASTNGGTNWTLPPSVIASMFYRIVVSPTNANELVVGTNAGALRSTGGQNGPWTTVIASASSPATTGYGDVTDIVRDPSNAQILYAATWDRNYHCLGSCAHPINFVSPTILKSTDGGLTWNPAANGLPVNSATASVNRWAIAIAPSNPQVLYAATSFSDPGGRKSRIYKTTNGGTSWTETNLRFAAQGSVNDYLQSQAWYDNTIVVAPSDANLVIAGGVTYVRSVDGGASWTTPPFAGPPIHADAHDLRYDSAGTLWVANDGGIWTSADHGNISFERNEGLVTRQYYAMANDVINRNRVLGGTQDNGTNTRSNQGGSVWHFFSGGDGFQCFIHPDAPAVAYSTIQFGAIQRTMNHGAEFFRRSYVTPRYPAGESGPFFSMLTADPVTPSLLYTGTYRIWKSTSGGDAWVPLSTNTSGGAWNASLVRSIAATPGSPQVLAVAKWASVYRSTNGGASWVFSSNGLPGKTINWVEIDPNDSNRMYAALAGTAGTSIYSTINGGTTWSPRGTGLPPFSALVVRVDPTDSSTLYCGTDVGVYRSTDSGATWSPFGTGMPAVSVYDLGIARDGSILRAATHGRGMWELDVAAEANIAPAVSIAVATGSFATVHGNVALSATAIDEDGDPFSLLWTYPDTWATTAGTRSVVHTFRRAGYYPVTLKTTDTHGGSSAAQHHVTVHEAADDCATPLVVPASGPFPWSVTLGNHVSSRQNSDPNSGGSCYPYFFDGALWLSFTPSVTALYTISLCGSRDAAWISGFTGPACGPYTATGFCHADLELTSDCGTDTNASTSLTGGTAYRFLAGNYYSASGGPITITVTRNFDLQPVTATVDPPAGGTAGGTVVVLTGSGFVNGATVSFGGVAATSVNVLTPNVLTAVTPAHAAGTVDVGMTNPSDTVSTLGLAFSYEAAPLSAPGNVAATATSGSSVTITWNAVPGASSYEVWRKAFDGPYFIIGTTAGLTLVDTEVVANSPYLYMVRAVDGPYSNGDFALTMSFTDDPLAATSTPVKAIHLTELRTAVNGARSGAGIGGFSFSETISAGGPVKAIHVTELRSALDAARFALGLPSLLYTNTLTANVTKIKAIDLTELRTGVK